MLDMLEVCRSGWRMLPLTFILFSFPALANNISSLLSQKKKKVEFNHVLRHANKATYKIAKHTRHVNEFLVWMENVSPHLFPVIQVELAFDQ